MNYSNWNSCIDIERNEFVFENRNKLFGAYVIRRDYPVTIIMALFGSCLFIAAILSPIWFLNGSSQSKPASDVLSEVISLETFTPPPVVITPPESTPQTTSSDVSKDLSNPVVVEDKLATKDLKLTNDITPKGIDKLNGGEIKLTSTTGISKPVIPDIIVDNDIKKWAEIMPKFQGGDANLMSYLSSNIRYPSRALMQNIAGTVYVSFIVDTSGFITNVQLIRGISDECDLEALKAVKNMPRWIPGSQNGNKVSVEMSLPVRFVIK